MFAPRVSIAALLCAASTSAFTQSYPTRPARMVVPWTAGGTADLSSGIAPNGEVAVKMFIDASATAQAGYRLYMFYP